MKFLTTTFGKKRKNDKKQRSSVRRDRSSSSIGDNDEKSVFAVQIEETRSAAQSREEEEEELYWDERSCEDERCDHAHHHDNDHDQYDLKNVLSCDQSCCMNHCTCESGLGGECPHHKPIQSFIYQVPKSNYHMQHVVTNDDIYIAFPRYFMYNNPNPHSVKRARASLVLTKLDSSRYVCRSVKEEDSFDVISFSGTDSMETFIMRIFSMINLHYVSNFTRSFECQARGRNYCVSMESGFISVTQLDKTYTLASTEVNVQVYPSIENLDNFVTNVLINPPLEFSQKDPFQPTTEKRQHLARKSTYGENVDEIFSQFVRKNHHNLSR